MKKRKITKKSEWERNCPECDRILYYINKYTLKRSINHNTLCHQCASMGDRNAMYGKPLLKETRIKMSIANSGKNNPNYGKSPSAETRQKMSEARKGKKLSKKTRMKMSISRLGKNNPMYGKHRKHSEKTRQKMRISAVKRIERTKLNGGQLHPNYSRKACMLFDWANMYHDLHIQHAENGGEFHVIGYFADGYDEYTNTWYEWDEKHHFDKDGNLKEKDIDRQKEIVKYLGCEFIRIRE